MQKTPNNLTQVGVLPPLNPSHKKQEAVVQKVVTIGECPRSIISHQPPGSFGSSDISVKMANHVPYARSDISVKKLLIWVSSLPTRPPHIHAALTTELRLCAGKGVSFSWGESEQFSHRKCNHTVFTTSRSGQDTLCLY